MNENANVSMIQGDALSTADTLQFLRNVSELEATINQLDGYHATLQERLERLQDPYLRGYEPYTAQESGDFHIPFHLWPMGPSFGFWIGLILAIVAKASFWEVICRAVGGALYGIPVGIGMIAAVHVLRESVRVSRRNAQIQKSNAEVDQRNRAIQIENEATKRLCQDRIPLVQEEMRRVEVMRAQTMSILDGYYDTGVVYPKYRGLVPIATFCEYFASGRCSSLRGHEGAYNLFENEARLARIETQLDKVIVRLDTIIDNQHMLASMLQQCSREIAHLSDSAEQQLQRLDRIEANTETAAYYARLTEQNTAYASFLLTTNAMLAS